MQQPSRRAIQSDLHCAGYVRSGNPVQRSLVEVNFYVVLHLWVFDIPIHIHDPRRGLKDLFDLLCQLDLLLLVGLVGIPLVAWTVLPGAEAVVLGIGWVVAYFVYEWIHAANHLWEPRTTYGRWARRSHFHHHFGAPLRNHGVTTPLWDKVFGTYDNPAQVTVPRRMAMVWLLDDAGEVHPEHRATYLVRGARTEIGPQEMGRAPANQVPTV